MTDNEIIKALECVLQFNNGFDKNNAIIALDLINRLQAENESITEKFNCQQTVYADLSKIIKDKNAEIERLKEQNDTLHKRYLNKHTSYCELLDELEEAKAEAYKEFAELLHCQYESIINQPHNESVRPISWKVAYEEFDERVDNLLKELVGEDK